MRISTPLALSILTPTLVCGLASCHDNKKEPEPPRPQEVTLSFAALPYGADNVWQGAEGESPVELDGFSFSHSVSDFGTIEGFTPARQTEVQYTPPMYEHQFRVITGGGCLGEGSAYLIGFWSSWEGSTPDTRSCRIQRTDGAAFRPHHVMATNSCYAFYAMLDGDDYTRPFADGDWLRLTAHGVGTDGETVTTEFYLANCQSKRAEEGILARWSYFDLTPLGEVTCIYFTMESSDTGEWGMNTPSYFALDQFTYTVD